MNQLTVTLPKFEGPLDLLLYLIRKEEMDIFDIKIHEITHQYLEYIKRMRELDLEVAGEFISMASTLIHIKSRMLLPQYNDQGEVVETEDPRKELVQRLLEYQKYQDAAKSLNERPMVGRDIWLRGTRESIKPQDDEILLEDNALFSLIASYRNALRSFQKKIHKVTKKAQSIAQRILEIKDRLVPGQRITLRELLVKTEDQTRQILITFLSLLELGKMGFVTLYQAETYGDIYVDTKKDIANDVISRVEEFDGLKSEEAADRLIQSAEAEKEALAQMPLAEDVEMADLGDDNMSFGAEEMASDEEILAAESELAKEELPETVLNPTVPNSKVASATDDNKENGVYQSQNYEENDEDGLAGFFSVASIMKAAKEFDQETALSESGGDAAEYSAMAENKIESEEGFDPSLEGKV